MEANRGSNSRENRQFVQRKQQRQEWVVREEAVHCLDVVATGRVEEGRQCIEGSWMVLYQMMRIRAKNRK